MDEKREYLEDREIDARIRTIDDFDGLVSLYKAEWDDGMTKSRSRRLFKKTFGLIVSCDQAINFWNALGGGGSTPFQDNLVLNKMIELIKTKKDLEAAYHVFGVEESELKRRRLLRKLFDKADKLRYPTI